MYDLWTARNPDILKYHNNYKGLQLHVMHVIYMYMLCIGSNVSKYWTIKE